MMVNDLDPRISSMATPICYEAILPYVCSRFDHPDLLVNVTNDGWFGTRPLVRSCRCCTG